MSNEEESGRSKIVNAIGIALIVISYTGALLNMLNTKRVEEWGDRKVIRISHWQLEAGYREGINYAIKEFEKLNPDVKIIQLPIYARAYAQFVRTQLIGGTAPDLIETDIVGGASTQMAGRYFYPITRELYKPNEFNAGNEFKDVPWIHTFLDGLSGAVNSSDQEIYGAGLNNFSTRLFYNKTLLKKIMGVDTLPHEFAEFTRVCDSIQSYAKHAGIVLFPIAGSSYQTGYVRRTYYPALTSKYFFLIDKNCGTEGQSYEKLYLYLRGDFDFHDPQLRAAEEIGRSFSKYYQPGFMAQDRMESTFAFAQQRALMISSGSWDYQSVSLQARDNGFELGITRLPMPSRTDPEYGPYVQGETYENAWTAGKFSISRCSKHPDVALKFLKFITSKDMNSRINKVIGWMPSIRNAPVDDALKPLLLIQRGYPAIFTQNLNIITGNKTNADDTKAYWEYISGTVDYNQFVKEIEGRLVVDGTYDIYQELLNQLDEFHQTDHDRSYYSAAVALAPSDSLHRDALEKLKVISSTYMGYRYSIADRGFGLWRVMQIKNDRTAKLADAPEFDLLKKLYGFDK